MASRILDNVARPDRALPDAISHLDHILSPAPAFLLDFDGVLSPIVDRPSEATIPTATHDALERLAARCPVAVITGRDRADVESRIDVPGVLYAGNHGLELDDAGPEPELAHKLDAAEKRLRDALDDVDGAIVERKRFSVAVHDRLVAPGQRPTVHRHAEDAAQTYGLRAMKGKRVTDLRSPAPMDKGTAVRHVLAQTGRGRHPIYIGDDVTDEDAFRAVRADGIGILVSPTDRPTAARYRLDDPRQVGAFLGLAAERLDA